MPSKQSKHTTYGRYPVNSLPQPHQEFTNSCGTVHADFCSDGFRGKQRKNLIFAVEHQTQALTTPVNLVGGIIK